MAHRASGRGGGVIAAVLVGLSVVTVGATAAPAPGSASAVPPLGWTDSAAARSAAPTDPTVVLDGPHHVVDLVRPAMDRVLAAARPASAIEVSLPTPDGGWERFQVTRSTLLAPTLAARYPSIRTYRGVGVDDRSARLVVDIGPTGLHAQVLSARGAWYVDPLRRSDDVAHVAYGRRSLVSAGAFTEVGVDRESGHESAGAIEQRPAARAGIDRRTYRLAISTTQEYSNFFAIDPEVPDAEEVMAAVTTAVNRVAGIYETELAITFQLVARTDELFRYAEPDGFANEEAGRLIEQNQRVTDDVIGNRNYDIGHVFSTGGGGLAAVGVVGLRGAKARAVTGRSQPTGDAFWVDYVAHEMGHQFGADHTFNGVDGSCGSNLGSETAVEPGSGTTIMSYAGICGADNTALNSDPFFHIVSIAEIVRTVAREGQGGTPSSTTNDVPTVRARRGSGCTPAAGPQRRCYVVPPRTPFFLRAAGTDPNEDRITYSWEQIDGFSARSLTATPKPDGALFRSFPPTRTGTRWFPNRDLVRQNLTNAVGRCRRTECWAEFLPTGERTMNFRVTARDNRSDGGGWAVADARVRVRGSRPFLVTAPNTAVTWTAGKRKLVTWNVAGTNRAPVSEALVDIVVSTDGGRSFTRVLAEGVRNDGSHRVRVPLLDTRTARIVVRAHDGIFYDMSDVDFRIRS